MSKLNTKVMTQLLKESEMYFEALVPVSDVSMVEKKRAVVLTKEHIDVWLEVFYDDLIMMDTCNNAKVKR